MKGKRRLPLPRLPRKWRIVRNAAAVLLLLGTLAAALDFPALTRYGTFRKLEEQYLLTPSRLVYRLDAPDGGAAFLTRGEGWYTVGKVLSIGSGGEALTNHYATITQVLPADRIQVVLLPLQSGDGETAAAAVGLPEGAASARLELTLEGTPLPWNYQTREEFGWSVDQREQFTAWGETAEEGCMLFSFPDHGEAHPDYQLCALDAVFQDAVFWEAPSPLPCRLTVWDAQGAELLNWEGTTAEGIMLTL